MSTDELPISFGPFRIVEADTGHYDFMLTDQRESAHIGFTEDEAPDLEVIAERVVGLVDDEVAQ